jgi:uncharacterized protein
VRGVYVDTSALGRVLLGEPDAPAVVGALARFERLVASRLLRVELRRLALREGLLPEADALLSAIALVPLDEPTAARAVAAVTRRRSTWRCQPASAWYGA